MDTNYNDIINLPHPVSNKHPQMSLHDRAAQFSPFAALTGYEEVIKEAGRITERKIEPNEEEIRVLNDFLRYLRENEKKEPLVQVTYFVPDEKKDGGSYITRIGQVRRVDVVNGILVFVNGEEIAIPNIVKLECAEIVEE